MDQDEPNFSGWLHAWKVFDSYVPDGTSSPKVNVTCPIPILPKNGNQK